jgi:hypothetical protein
MKTSFRLLAAVFVFAFVSLIRADDFQSMVILGDGVPVALPRIHGNQVMVIRNFTQEAIVGAARGFVTVTKPPNSGTQVNVLTAAALDASTPDIINSVVIAGPADVSVTCGPTAGFGNCFISFKKD